MTNKDDRIAAIREAIDRGGGVMKFAQAMKVTHQAVYHWLNRGFVPLERAVAIEAIFKVDRKRIMDPAVLEAFNSPAADYI